MKLRAADGKMRLTDVADTELLFRIIQSRPSRKCGAEGSTMGESQRAQFCAG